ncbi:MAG: TetR/AcrR family transcriptional regulator [Parvibaculaceae bacterium]|nr:TetR/AcrR family transcriptional regulator [Parvibaculaceae bacterium]
MSGNIHDMASEGWRGPADHIIRGQIMEAADAHFRQFGYGKTTVSGLAGAIGFSKAYIYKFFDSKQAIGEAIAMRHVVEICDAAEKAVKNDKTSPEKLRLLFRSVTKSSVDLFFLERQLYDMVSHAVVEDWHCNRVMNDRMQALVESIVKEGRLSGAFERKTPLDETCRAIRQAMKSFCHPAMLAYNLDNWPKAQNELVNLVLRSLAP